MKTSRKDRTHSAQTSVSVSQFKPIVPAPYPKSSILDRLTPDPSPTMNPQDPKTAFATEPHQENLLPVSSTRSQPSQSSSTTTSSTSNSTMSSSTSGSAPSSPKQYHYQHYHSHQHQQQQQQQQQPQPQPIQPQQQGRTSVSSSPALQGTNSRALHTLYHSSTPPMSPAPHILPSPSVSGSRHHSFSMGPPSDPAHGGFYQLPPPLQAFRAPHQDSTTSSSASSSSTSSSSATAQHSLPPASSVLPSPQAYHPHPPPQSHFHSLPQTQHQTSFGVMSPRTSGSQSSPRVNHHITSPAIGPLSPYPTPQPQHHSSPHQSPRYDRILPKNSNVPTNLSLPASVLSGSTLVFQTVPPPTPASSSSSTLTSRSAFHATPFQPTPPGKSPASSPQISMPLKSPRHGSTSSTRSTPASPQRFMMLPPQTAPGMAQSTQQKSSSAKRRSSSNSKPVDQETRDMMRKVSHSAIERRRRERINDKILQLKHLVPSCVDEDHLHKLSILQSTIEYIQHLKSIIPASVANAKFKKATNNNPANNTTSMLEAVNAGISPTVFVPMINTGLDQPYPKRIKTESSQHLLGQQQQQQQSMPSAPQHSRSTRSSTSSASSGSSSTSSTTAPKSGSTPKVFPLDHQAQYQEQQHQQQHQRRHHQQHQQQQQPEQQRDRSDDGSNSTCQSPSDEDAKDGLLLLSQSSSTNVSPNLYPSQSQSRGLMMEQVDLDAAVERSRNKMQLWLDDEDDDEDMHEDEKEAERRDREEAGGEMSEVTDEDDE